MPAASRLPNEVLTEIFISVMQYRHIYGHFPRYPQQPSLLKCLTLSKRFYDIVLPVWLGDTKVDLCTERGREALHRLVLLGSRELVEVLDVKIDWTQASHDMASFAAFQNVRELKLDFGPGTPKDGLGRVFLPLSLKDALANLPRLDSLMFYPPILIPRDWAPVLSRIRKFNSDYISFDAGLQWCLSQSRTSRLDLVVDGAKAAITQGSEIGLIPWGPDLRTLSICQTPNVGPEDMGYAMRHCYRAVRRVLH